MNESSLGIYFHVPFCAKKCPYCDFYSVPFSKSLSSDYVDAVLRNVNHYGDNSFVDTIYFGGGTPSLLTVQQIEKIINTVRKSFNVDKQAEITIEANPAALNYEKLTALYEAGINRLSLGVQSMIEDELKFLGRIHSPEKVRNIIHEAKMAGFSNISCDLMIGLPNQTTENIAHSIECLSEMQVNHISSYILKIENNTPFFFNGVSEMLPSDDDVSDIYLFMCDELEKYGFMQYEISNFAREGFKSRHNSRYWKCLDYIGIGPAAHSGYKGRRFAVAGDVMKFIGEPFQTEVDTDTNPFSFEEKCMLSLRLTDGIDVNKLGIHKDKIMSKLPKLIENGLIISDGKKIALTKKGFLMSNSIIEYLIFE